MGSGKSELLVDSANINASFLSVLKKLRAVKKSLKKRREVGEKFVVEERVKDVSLPISEVVEEKKEDREVKEEVEKSVEKDGVKNKEEKKGGLFESGEGVLVKEDKGGSERLRGESEGLELPESEKINHNSFERVEQVSVSEESGEELRNVYEEFPLIKLRRGDKEITYVTGLITWVEEDHSLKYFVREPQLSEKELKVLEEVKEILRKKLDVEFKKEDVELAFNYLKKMSEEIYHKIGLKLSDAQRLKFEYYIFRDFIGLGKIEPLMHDSNIEDISCDGAGIPIFVYHRNPKYGGLKTNIVFESNSELDSFVLRLAQKTGRALSIAEPLLDGTLPDGSRVQATYGSDIARRGSNFTIRKFTKEPITPVHEVRYKTASPEILAYLWLAIENGLSILIAGPTATGKTSLLNAISLFIRPEAKIVSIEDTAELRLPHPNWIAEVARSGFGRESYGEVSLFDLLKASLRQRPDYLIVGEVRGAEANVMFQAMATGHAGLGTLHADNLSAVYDRLTTKPIDLPPSMLENLDLIIFLTLTKRKDVYVRKIKEVVEVLEYDINSNKLITNKAFEWDVKNDVFKSYKSKLLSKIMNKMGLSEEGVLQELLDRAKVVKWLFKRGVFDFREVSKTISKYYHKKGELMKTIESSGVL